MKYEWCILCFQASKKEAFFESQGWLDSDSEDDFVSVNGGITAVQNLKISCCLFLSL